MAPDKLIRSLLAALAAASSPLWTVHAAPAQSDASREKKPSILWGQLAIHPYYRLAELYDSNIYLLPGPDVTGSWITENLLGLGLQLPVHKVHTWEAGYEFRARNYTSQPRVNDNIAHAAHLAYGYDGAYGLAVKARDNYIDTTDPASSELTNRQRRWRNMLTASVGYAPDRNRLTAEADYMDTRDKYESPSYAADLDRYDAAAGLKIGYLVRRKTSLFVAYHRGQLHYSVPPPPGVLAKDNKYHHAQFGAEGEFSAQLSGLIETGMKYRKFDTAGPDGTTKKMDWTVGTRVTWRPEQRTSGVLSVYRSPQESAEREDRDYIANDFLLTVRHDFPRRLSVALKGGVSINKYTQAQTTGGLTAVRRDDIYTQGVLVEKELRTWLKASLDYAHVQRNSIFTRQYNYEDHIGAVSVAASF